MDEVGIDKVGIDKVGINPPDPPSGCALHTLLHFAKYSDQVHTGIPLFKILDPPLVRLAMKLVVLQGKGS